MLLHCAAEYALPFPKSIHGTPHILNVGVFSHLCLVVKVLIIRLCLFYFCELFFGLGVLVFLSHGIVSSIAGSRVPKSKA